MSTFDAWAAGFFDGEGCIALRQTRDKRLVNGVRGTGGRVYEGFNLVAQVGQAGFEIPEPLLLLREAYGGHIGAPAMPREGRNNKKPLYTWKVIAQQAEDFLVTVFPYLVVKREQARMALEYRELYLDTTGGG